MLEDFATPPSSPPLGGVAGMLPEALRHHNIKASSVTWCTDYLEVMGCEKQHNFKVNESAGRVIAGRIQFSSFPVCRVFLKMCRLQDLYDFCLFAVFWGCSSVSQ